MALTVEDNAITQKTKELCETILTHPDFRSLRANIDTFMADDQAKNDYQSLVEKSEELHHKQHQGARLSQEEIDAYEKQRERVVGNPVAAAFIRAQQEVQGVQESINRYVAKSIELGRVPSEEELSGDGSCGSGCGCSH